MQTLLTIFCCIISVGLWCFIGFVLAPILAKLGDPFADTYKTTVYFMTIISMSLALKANVK